ncbi:monocarboxylate transporter 12-like isoform X1 [Stegodyphus dumicola]|uniref:monocarboxylate transporter 12-like isoform X1 n=1 Tax=Stegodyphus dumicola TaxID=202533 RepID=UPI0015ADFDD9|nr:monocarboxylate transporter 12-like isoform X1 [Stegodyphus dumicola]
MAAASATNRAKSELSVRSNVIVILSAFWVNFCLLGVRRIHGVIYRALIDTFEVSREDAAWPFGILGFFMCVTGAVSGFLSHSISVRTLAVFGTILASVSVITCSCASHITHIAALYGALQGIGIGIIVPLTNVLLNQNFSRYKACALGIVYSGSSIGSFIFPPITNFFLNGYGLHGTFLLLGGIMLNSLVGAILYRTPNLAHKLAVLKTPLDGKSCTKCEEEEKSTENNKSLSLENGKRSHFRENISEKATECIAPDPEKSPGVSTCFKCESPPTVINLAVEILANPSFLIISAVYAAYFTLSNTFLMVVIDFAADRGVTIDKSVFFVSAFSIGDLVGRLSFGWIADMQFIRRSNLIRSYLFVMGTLTAVLPFCCYVELLFAASIVLGILSGSVMVNHSVLLSEYLGLQKLPIAMGFSVCLVGLTSFLRPVIIGFFRDERQNYDQLFIFLGLLVISITLIWSLELLSHFINRYRNTVNKILPQ